VTRDTPPGGDSGDVTIAVDAMGGDHAPDAIVAGAAAAAEAGVSVILTGRPGQLRSLIASQPGHHRPANGAGPGRAGLLRVAAAEDSIAMDEGALASWRRPRSSAAVACSLVRRGQAHAVVSAGSTAGIVVTARLRLRPLPGVARPGLAVLLPTQPRPTVLIDAGAIADPKPEMLLTFAHLGVAYAQLECGISEPAVGLLTIGSEPSKGNRVTRRAHELLAGPPPHGNVPLNFIGNVEGSDLLASVADVIVTDGFTGNVALKTIEGTAAFAAAQLQTALTSSAPARAGRVLARRALRAADARMDSDSYGGAALLGLEGTVVIAHGASNPKAITSAIHLAAALARGHLTDKIRDRLGSTRGTHFLRRTPHPTPTTSHTP